MAVRPSPSELLGARERTESDRATGAGWSFAAAVIAAVLLLTSLPFIFAYASTPPERYFTGVMVNIPDHNQYFAWMRDLSHQHLAANRLTPEPNEPALFHLLWWSAGRAGAFLGLEFGAVFGSLRICATILFLASAYAFFRIAVADKVQQRLAFILFAFGGGLGVIWIAVKYAQGLPEAPFPFDIYTAEPNSFFIALAFPHFGVALGLIIALISLTLYAQQRGQLRYAVLAGMVGVLIGLQHAYDLLTVGVVLGLWWLLIWWRDRRFPTFLFKAGLIIAACALPPAAYLSYLVLTDATWGGKLAQFDNAGAWTPGPLHLPILMGLPLLLALLVFRPRMLRSRDDAELLVAVWFLAHFVLAYLPLSFQIHLLLGWQVPIALLAARAIQQIVWPWLQTRGPGLARLALATILGLCVLTNLYIFFWRFYDLARYSQPFFLSQDEVGALRWLGAHTTSQDVVLGVLEINQHVPVWSDARAYVAHWAGSLDFFTKRENAKRVVNPATPRDERRALLNEFGVSYVIVREQDSSRVAFAASAGPELIPVYENATVTVYRVLRAVPASRAGP
ncbi:MAG: hypothetical protein ACUVS4_05765 [Chloroflexaceae bacterium]